MADRGTPDTIGESLERYRIGAKIKALRLGKDMGLVQLGQHTLLSPGLLSRIERGQLVPTLPTLVRIALVFGVGLEHFFAEDDAKPKRAVVRKRERLRLPIRAETEDPAYYFESLDFPVSDRKMEAFYAQFESDLEATPHRHEGAEIIYVIGGSLAVRFEDETVSLEAGDSMYFDSAHPHSYRRIGDEACSAMVVVAR